MNAPAVLYRGDLVHVRHDEHARTFRYPVYIAGLDLDRLPEVARARRLFSFDRPNLFSLYGRDFACTGGGVRSLRDGHAAALAAHGLPAPARVELITWLRTAHFLFNPVSFFIGRDAGGAITSVLAEVRNNYGGHHPYVLGPHNLAPPPPSAPTPSAPPPASAPPAPPAAPFAPSEARPGRVEGLSPIRFRVAKSFFVSPFLHGPATYDFSFSTDPRRLDIHMDVHRPDGARLLTAHLRGTPTPLTDRALAAAALRYPFMSLQVIGLIYAEALLAHARGVPFRRPGPDHAVTDPPAPLPRNFDRAPASRPGA